MTIAGFGLKNHVFACCTALATVSKSLWLPRMIYSNLFYHVNCGRLRLYEGSIHAAFACFFSSASLSIGLLANRVDIQRDGSCLSEPVNPLTVSSLRKSLTPLLQSKFL